ncbi:unnamed protein product [Lathyrus oleraceus]
MICLTSNLLEDAISVRIVIKVLLNSCMSNGVEENPVNNFIESFSDCNAIDLANDQLAGHPNKHELVNQVNIKTRTDSLKVEDSFINPKEFIDESRETSVVEKEDLHASNEETTLNSASELENLIFVKETKPLEFSIHSQSYIGSSDSASGVSVIMVY